VQGVSGDVDALADTMAGLSVKPCVKLGHCWLFLSLLLLQGVSGDVDALADTMAGLSVKPVQVAQPKGLLKGVAAPAGGL
jgi:hypothetical protein